MAKVRVRVVHGRRAVGGPAGMGNTGAAFDVVGLDLVYQLRYARRAARALQAPLLRTQTGCMHRHSARVVTTVFEPLQTLDKDRNDVARRNRADDATHKKHS